MHAPHLVDVEIASVLRLFVRRREIPAAAGRRALAEVPGLIGERYGADLLLPRIWALRNVLSAYDAAYVALAEVLELPLVTTDLRLARSRGHRAEIVEPPS